MKFQPGDLVQVIKKTDCNCDVCKRVFVGMPGVAQHLCMLCTFFYNELAWHVDVTFGCPAFPESHLRKIEDPDAGETVTHQVDRPLEAVQ